MNSRKVLRQTSMKLISDWRATHDVLPEAPAADHIPPEKAAAGTPKFSAADSPAPPPAPAAAAPSPAAGQRQGPGQGVAPGSFLGLMLAARDKKTGQELTDLQVIEVLLR